MVCLDIVRTTIGPSIYNHTPIETSLWIISFHPDSSNLGHCWGIVPSLVRSYICIEFNPVVIQVWKNAISPKSMNIWVILQNCKDISDEVDIKIRGPFDSMWQGLIFCIIKVELQMPSAMATWHQVVQTVVQTAMNSKCINTDPNWTIISAVKGNP
jgi:hypothetical protein